MIVLKILLISMQKYVKSLKTHPTRSSGRTLPPAKSESAACSSHSPDSKDGREHGGEAEAADGGGGEDGSTANDHGVWIDTAAVVGAGHVVSGLVLKIYMW